MSGFIQRYDGLFHLSQSCRLKYVTGSHLNSIDCQWLLCCFSFLCLCQANDRNFFYSIRWWSKLAFTHLSTRRYENNAANLYWSFMHPVKLIWNITGCVLLFLAVESFGGQRLLQRADINIGSHITSFFRIRARTTGKVGGKDLRQLTCFGKFTFLFYWAKVLVQSKF